MDDGRVAAPLAALRAHFPVLDSTVVYLNSNSTGAFPRGMQEEMQRYWEELADWRDGTWERWWAQWLHYADSLARFIGAPAGSVVTDTNLSSLLGRVVGALDFGGPRNAIVTTELEFPTVPFICKAARARGARVETVAAAGGRVCEDELCARIDERTALVIVTHAAFATGALLDLAPVVARARAMGALVLVDAYQSVGTVPVNVSELGVDFLLAGAHKWLCGSTESAFLYVRPEIAALFEPVATGWIAGAEPLSFEPQQRWAAGARRFASGTPAVLPARLSQIGLDLLAAQDMREVRAHSLRCTALAIALADEAGLEVLTPREPGRRGGIVALQFPGSERACARMVEAGYICSWRGALRIAPHVYNTQQEVLRFMVRLTAEAYRCRHE